MKKSKLWMWNRFTAFVYHVTRRIKTDSRDGLEHLKECEHCKRKFEKWLESKAN